MKKIASMLLVLPLLFVGSSSKLRGQPTARIVGTVVDTQGNPVPGVRIVAQDSSGNVVAETVADAEGRYSLENLPVGPESFTLALDPVQTGFLGETVVVSLVEEGLTVNWIVSSSTTAVAFASPGVVSGGIFGLGPTATGFIGVLFLGGTVFGLSAAAGVFNGPATASQ